MTAISLSCNQLSQCAHLATSMKVPKEAAKVFAWWCSHLVDKHANDKEIVQALKDGASSSFWHWLETRMWRQKGFVPWEMLMHQLKVFNRTLASFLEEFFRCVPVHQEIARQCTLGHQNVAYRSVPVQVPSVPVQLPSVPEQLDVAFRSVPKRVEPSVSPEREREPVLCWAKMNRTQRANVLLGKVIKHGKVSSKTIQYRHLNNVLKGHRTGKRKLTPEEQSLVGVMEMSQDEKIAMAVLSGCAE